MLLLSPFCYFHLNCATQRMRAKKNLNTITISLSLAGQGSLRFHISLSVCFSLFLMQTSLFSSKWPENRSKAGPKDQSFWIPFSVLCTESDTVSSKKLKFHDSFQTQNRPIPALCTRCREFEPEKLKRPFCLGHHPELYFLSPAQNQILLSWKKKVMTLFVSSHILPFEAPLPVHSDLWHQNFPLKPIQFEQKF